MFVYTRVRTHTSLSKSTYTQSIFSFKCRRLSYSHPSVRDPLIGRCPLTHFIYLFLYIPFPFAPLLPTDHIPNVFDEYPHVCMCSFNIYTSISFAYLLRKWNRAMNFRYRVLRFFEMLLCIRLVQSFESAALTASYFLPPQTTPSGTFLWLHKRI